MPVLRGPLGFRSTGSGTVVAGEVVATVADSPVVASLAVAEVVASVEPQEFVLEEP